MKEINFTKGYTIFSEQGVQLGFIPEGSEVEVMLITGEVKTGELEKPAKKEFRLSHDGLTEVIEVAMLSDMKVVGTEYEE